MAQPCRKAVLFDDSASQRTLVITILTRAGMEVVSFADALDAVAAVRLHRPDVVIMDVVMPGVSGFEAARRLHEDPETSAIPVIMLTSKDSETDRIWAARQGAVAYLAKPVQEAALLAAVTHITATLT